MNLLSRWAWIRPAAWRRRSAPLEQDPGDMGTAFGLDASIELTSPQQLAYPGRPGVPLAPWADRLLRRPQR